MKLSCFLFFILIPLFGAQEFRKDYSFYKNLNGWLKVHHIPDNWQEAMLTCQLEGANLASPTDSIMLEAMTFLVITSFSTEKSVYTGIHSTFAKGQFFSIDGIPLSRMTVKWAPDEPNNFGGNEDCLILHTNGTVGDVECSTVHPYICFKKRTDDMPAINECGTIDREYKYSNITGTCLKFHTVPRNWERAFKTCSAEGGYLAIPNSQAEAELLKKLHLEKRTDGKERFLFVGFRFSHALGIWLTIKGQTLTEAGYDHWAGANPNNLIGGHNNFEGEYCGTVDASRADVGLNDEWCRSVKPFICEIDLNI